MEQTQIKPIDAVHRIILGLTGGIAAYKAAELTRLLVKQNISVRAVMTEAACHFITPITMQALSGQPVLTSQWDDAVEPTAGANGMAHINLSRTADAIVIAPATADFIAKLAHGLADDLLSTLCLARDCPLLIAPAMNRQMWENAATQRNIAQLLADGVVVLGPASGAQACGEEGMGRMVEAEELAREIVVFLRNDVSVNVGSSTCSARSDGQVGTARRVQSMLCEFPASPLALPRRERELGMRMVGVRVLITAGPTYEAIDTVRGITNRSSGKMGYAVAQAAMELGAEVTIISGPVSLSKPHGAQVIDVTSAAEMFVAVKKLVAASDIFIGVAAVADYRVAQTSEQKIKKSGGNMTLELTPNPDILGYVAGLEKPPFCVGFAAESEHLREHATAKRKAKKLPLLAANLAQQAIGADDNELILFDDAGEHVLPRSDKLSQARALLQHLAQLYRQGSKQ